MGNSFRDNKRKASAGPAPNGKLKTHRTEETVGEKSRPPLVSIGLPVYNGEKYLRHALDCLLSQDYPNFELIISDNASTDTTGMICKEYARRDGRIKYTRNFSNIGALGSTLKLIEMVSGEYFMWASHDDWFSPSYIRLCLEKLQQNANAVMCCSEIEFIDADGNTLGMGYGSYTNIQTLGMDIPNRIHELISRMGWFAIYGLFKTAPLRNMYRSAHNLNSYGADVIVLLYLMLAGEFAKVPEKLFHYRVLDREKTAEEFASAINPALVIGSEFKPYTYLASELYRTVLLSDLDREIKAKIRGVFANTLSFENSDWLSRIARENGRKATGAPQDNLRLVEDVVLRAAEKSQALDIANRKKVLIFFPQNLMPPSAGNHWRGFEQLLSFKAAGYDVTLASTTLFSNPPWTAEGIRALESQYGIRVLVHQGTAQDQVHMRSHDSGSDWRHYVPPSLSTFFRKVYAELSPDIVLINYAMWAELVNGPEFEKSLLVNEMHDLVTYSRQMQDLALQTIGNVPVDPGHVESAVLDENFYKHVQISPSPMELEIYDKFDVVSCISESEAEIVRKNTRRPQVLFLPHMPKARFRKNFYDGPPVFLIGPNAFNLQGYAYLANRVLPLVRERCPEFFVRIAGTECRNLVAAPGLELAGFVPDLEELYSHSSFSLCPLIGGTGQQIKIVEAMAHGVPVITLSNVSASSPVVHKVNGFIADNAEEFANYVIFLHKDRDLCRELGEAARQTVFENHFQNANNKKLFETIEVGLSEKKKAAVSTATPQASQMRLSRKRIGIGLVEHLGDIVACEPVVRYVRQQCPEAEITWVINRRYRELVDYNPHVDRVLAVECLSDWMQATESGLFDEVVDLHVNQRVCTTTGKVLNKQKGNPAVDVANYYKFGSLLSAFCQGAGLPPLDMQPEVYIPGETREKIDTLGLPEKFIVVHCASNEVSRDWTQDKWLKTVELINRRWGIPVVELGTVPACAPLKGRSGYIDLCGSLSILETAEVMRRSLLFIGIDSCLAHIANALGLFGIMILGRYRIFDHYMPYSGDYGKGRNCEILFNHNGPAAEIAVEEVFEAVKRRLEGQPPLLEAGEEPKATSDREKRSTKLIAFYLPQYHPIPENDAWWGKGFTEWTNVVKARPMFDGHYQPHLPADLGFYDLRLPEVRKAQVDLAREYGIYGFCYYHYWFGGRRLLERPFAEVLASGEPDFPFCLCWANENWTRAWDGQYKDVLAEQVYSEEDDRNHIRWLLDAFRDKRYIRINNRPLMMIYSAGKHPDPRRMTQIWREEAGRKSEELYLCKVESSREEHSDPEQNGFDACIEFQPDWVNLPAGTALPNGHLVFDYPVFAQGMVNKPIPPYKRYPCVTPMWDNSARRKTESVILHNSSPEQYAKWLEGVIGKLDTLNLDERIVFVNAWNEWGEGNHLEPDAKHGRGYLEATRTALLSESSAGPCRRETPTVSIIIPTFNNLTLTRQCLDAIRGTAAAGTYEIVTVDNGSTDGTRDFLTNEQSGGRLKAVLNNGNLGFARACNLGTRAASSKYLLFLNNDTVPTSGWLDTLTDAAEKDPGIGALGAKLLYPDGTIQHCGVVAGMRDGEPYPYHIYLCHPADAPHVNKFREFQMLTGACLMVPRELFVKLGGFDESFNNGHEDLDLCLRIGQAGRKVVYCPKSVVIHLEARTKRLMGLDNFHYRKGLENEEGRGRRRFLEKWGKALRIDDNRYFAEDGFSTAAPAVATPSAPAEKGGVKRILFTMYGWDDEGGGTILPRQIANALAARGYELSVIFTGSRSMPGKGDYYVEETSENGIRLFGIYNRPAVFYDLENPLREVDDPNMRNIVSSLIARLRPDIVHYHSLLNFSMGVPEAVSGAGIPSVYTSHNYWPLCPRMYLFQQDLSLCPGPSSDGNRCAECIGSAGKAAEYALRAERGRRMFDLHVGRHLAVSDRVRRLFIENGHSPDRIHVLQQQPETVERIWRQTGVCRTDTPTGRPIKAGFIGSLLPQKGVHVLIAAGQAFQPDRLEIHIFGSGPAAYVNELKKIDRKRLVRFHGHYDLSSLPDLLGAVDLAVVPSVWEDCAPLVVAEALAARLPVLGSRIGGIPEFIREGVNGFLFDPGNPDALAGVLRPFVDNPSLIGRMRQNISPGKGFDGYLDELLGHYNEVASGAGSVSKSAGIGVRSERTLNVVWEGSQFVYHSLALINRELCLKLIDAGHNVAVIPYEKDQFGPEVSPRFQKIASSVGRNLAGTPDVHIRHQWPPNFTPPPAGHWVMIQPWEFGRLPADWVRPMNELVDEIWVPSKHVLKSYVTSGVSIDRVKVIPNGVDMDLFHPGAVPYRLNTGKKFKFLFVGGTIWRKGIDLLLKAYCESFRREDDVTLVIKDMGQDSFYKGQGVGDSIRRIQDDPAAPELVYLTDMIEERDMPGLFTACDCLVHPYRGEGFGLPVLEAMACGIPVIVTSGGATDDFCPPEFSYQVASARREINMDGMPLAGGAGYVLEPDVASIREMLRAAYDNPADARQKAAGALEHVRSRYTWDNIAAMVEERIRKIAEKPVLRPAGSTLHSLRSGQAPSLSSGQAHLLPPRDPEQAGISFHAGMHGGMRNH